MKHFRLIFILALVATFNRPAGAVEGARYLLGNEGVRSSALAGAVGALPGSAEAIWYNPAGMPGIDGVEAKLTHMSFPGAWDSDHLVLVAPYEWKHYLGLLYHRNAATDTLRDASGNEFGGFEVSQSVLGAAYAYRNSMLRAGVMIKNASETVASTSASGLMLDLGLQSDLVAENVLLGLAVQNLGSAPDLGGPTINAPTLVRASLGLRFSGEISSINLLSDYHYHLASNQSDVAVGLEYAEKYLDGRLGLRAGWDFSQSDLGGTAGLSLGAGFGYGPVGLDYAWTPRESLGSQQRVALTLLWDLRARQAARELAAMAPAAEGPEASAGETPTPTPTPLVAKHGPGLGEVGNRLDALLAATPSPTPQATPTPLPVIEEKKTEPKGLIGFFFNLFGGKKKTEEPAEAKPASGGILQGVFHFLGIGPSTPAEIPASQPTPGAEADTTPEAAEPTPVPTPTALPMQKLKGDSPALMPTPAPTPMAQKVKSWMKF